MRGEKWGVDVKLVNMYVHSCMYATDSTDLLRSHEQRNIFLNKILTIFELKP